MDHLRTLGVIGLDLDGVDQLVDFGIRIIAVVERAVGAFTLAVDERLQRVVRVKGRHAPAKKVGAGVAVGDFREEFGARHGVELALDANLGPHCQDGLADGFIVDVAIVRAIQGQLEIVVVARLLEQRPRLFGVIGHALAQLWRIARHLRCDHRARRQRHPAHHRLPDRLDVDRPVKRLAHTNVVQRILALDVAVLQFGALDVEPDVNGAVFVAVQYLGLLAQAIEILGGRVEHEVDFAGKQRGSARGILLDRRVDDFRHISFLRRLAPPVFVFNVDGLDIHLARLELVGACAHGVATGIALFVVIEILRRGCAVLLRPRAAHDRKHRQLAKQDRVGSLQHDVDRQRIDRLDVLDPGDIGLELRGGRHRALEREDHVIGGKGGAIMELDPFAQLEAPECRVDLLPRCRKRWNDLELFVIANQWIVDPEIGCDVQAFVLRVRIHREDIALAGPFEGFCKPDAGQEKRGRKGGGKEGTAHGRLQGTQSFPDGYCQQARGIVKRFLPCVMSRQGITLPGFID